MESSPIPEVQGEVPGPLVGVSLEECSAIGTELQGLEPENRVGARYEQATKNGSELYDRFIRDNNILEQREYKIVQKPSVPGIDGRNATVLHTHPTFRGDNSEWTTLSTYVAGEKVETYDQINNIPDNLVPVKPSYFKALLQLCSENGIDPYPLGDYKVTLSGERSVGNRLAEEGLIFFVDYDKVLDALGPHLDHETTVFLSWIFIDQLNGLQTRTTADMFARLFSNPTWAKNSTDTEIKELTEEMAGSRALLDRIMVTYPKLFKKLGTVAGCEFSTITYDISQVESRKREIFEEYKQGGLLEGTWPDSIKPAETLIDNSNIDYLIELLQPLDDQAVIGDLNSKFEVHNSALMRATDIMSSALDEKIIEKSNDASGEHIAA